MIRTDPEGRIRINPVFLWAFVTYLIGVALAAGGALAQLSAARRDIDGLRTDVRVNVRSRAEGDEIIRRIDSEMESMRNDIAENRTRLVKLEDRAR